MLLTLPPVMRSSEDNQKTSFIKTHIQQGTWVCTPKLMGKTYRFLASQSEWINGTFPDTNLFFTDVFDKLTQFYRSGSLTPYQFYKCHFIIPELVTENINQIKKIFKAGRDTLSNEQACKMYNYQNAPPEARDTLFPNNLYLYSNKKFIRKVNLKIFLSLFNIEKRKEIQNQVDSFKLSIRLPTEQLNLLLNLYNGQLPSLTWPLIDLLMAYVLYRKGVEGFQNSLELIDKKLTALINSGGTAITPEEFFKALPLAMMCPQLNKKIKKQFLQTAQYFFPNFVFKTQGESLFLEIIELPPTVLASLLSESVKVLRIQSRTLLTFLNSLSKDSYFQSVESLLLCQDQKLVPTPAETSMLMNVFPRLKSLSILGESLNSENSKALADNLENLCVIGDAAISPNVVKVGNLIHLTTVNRDFLAAINRHTYFLITPQTHHIDFSNFPDLPDSFFSLFFSLPVEFESFNLKGCKNLTDFSLRLLPSCVSTLNLRDCPLITSEGIARLRKLNLRSLTVNNFSMSQKILERLLPKLESLSVKNIRADLQTSINLPYLKLREIRTDDTLCPRLMHIMILWAAIEKIKISTCKFLDNYQIQYLLNTKKCVHLKDYEKPIHLHLQKNTSLESLSLKKFHNPLLVELWKFTNLSYLDLSESYHVCEELLLLYLPHLKQLQTLKLNNCGWLTDRTLLGLSLHLNNLEDLEIQNSTQITINSINYIAQYCTNLRRVNLSGCHQIKIEELTKTRNQFPYVGFILEPKPFEGFMNIEYMNLLNGSMNTEGEGFLGEIALSNDANMLEENFLFPN